MLDLERLDKLITRIRHAGMSSHDSIVALNARKEILDTVEILIDYWDINHTDRRCTVCHGTGDIVEVLGMMEDLVYPMMKTEECENCLGKGTVTA